MTSPHCHDEKSKACVKTRLSSFQLLRVSRTVKYWKIVRKIVASFSFRFLFSKNSAYLHAPSDEDDDDGDGYCSLHFGTLFSIHLQQFYNFYFAALLIFIVFDNTLNYFKFIFFYTWNFLTLNKHAVAELMREL